MDPLAEGAAFECDDSPSARAAPGRLFLWFPVGLAARRVTRYLRSTERPFGTTYNGAVAMEVAEGTPDKLLSDLNELLTDDEAADTRCVFKLGGGDVDVDDIHRIRTMRQVRERQSSSWLVEMLGGDRLRSVFQPIVHADQPSRVFGHEALVRGVAHDGRTMSPARLFDAARTCGMVTELDAAAHRSAIRAAATHNGERHLFLNFTASTIRDGAHCLAATFAAIDAAAIPRNRVVLEVIESAQTLDMRHLSTVLRTVRDAGSRVALDDVGCGERSRRLIHEVRPDFIKLDMEEVRRVSGGPSVRDAERLLDLAQRLRIETIAESVETDEELDWNRKFGATYVQGYFIGRPAALSA